MPRTIRRTTLRNMHPLSIGVTAGVNGQNRFVFKQVLQTRVLDVHRIDGIRPARSASSAKTG